MTWRKVEGYVTWKPEVGETLEGVYVGPILRQAVNGEYNVHLIREDRAEGVTFSITGTVLDILLRVGNIRVGDCVKVVFRGWEESKNTGNLYRNYDLYVGE